MDAFIGMISPFGFNFAPRQWGMCNGALIAISQNSALFSLIGTYYGGDGRTTFGLPDLRGRSAIGYGHGPGLSSYNIGMASGFETQTLNVLQMPSHTHSAVFTPTPGGAPLEVTVEASTDAGETAAPAAGSYLATTVAGGGGQDKPEKIYRANAGTGTVTLGGVTAMGGGTSGTVTVGQTGGTQAFSILNPFQAINYSICMYGIFPSRN